MENLQGSAARRALLDEWMDRRRRELRLRWSQVAQRAGMGTPNLLRIRTGKISISWNAADGIADALEWERGSVEAIVNEGKDPTPKAPDTPSPRPVRWTREKEALFRELEAAFAARGLELNKKNWRRVEQELELEERHRAAPTGDHSA